jgi:uncharacterized protein YqjF (DUF2071 family)
MVNARTLFPRAATNAQEGISQRCVWVQRWHDVLFLHWRVPVAALHSLVPAGLEVEEYAGSGWVSLVLFRLRVRPRWLPALPGISDLVEANLRTYVRSGSGSGICFLSVHADNRWAIALAKWLTPMPYARVAMSYERRDSDFRFVSGHPRSPDFRLALQFRPGPDEQTAREGTLDAWLLERYRLFIQDRRHRLLRAEVTHPPWACRRIEALQVRVNTAGASCGLDLSGTPNEAHFCAGVRAYFGSFYPVENTESQATLTGFRRLQGTQSLRPGGHAS